MTDGTYASLVIIIAGLIILTLLSVFNRSIISRCTQPVHIYLNLHIWGWGRVFYGWGRVVVTY